jgi:nicotinate-nucleotide pyrophosphorylase
VRHGGTNHRIGLWDEVLLKNHFAMGGQTACGWCLR